MVRRQRTWREQHPFLYGLSQTFGIFQVRRPVETVEESLSRTFEDIEDAITEASDRDLQLVENILAQRFSGGIHRNLEKGWVQTGPDQVNIAALAQQIIDALSVGPLDEYRGQ